MRAISESADSNSIKVGTIKDAMARYRYGRATLMKIANECDAVIRIGRTIRINFTKMDEYFDKGVEI